MIKKEITLDSKTVRASIKAINFALEKHLDDECTGAGGIFTPNDERLLANYTRKLGVIR